MFCLPRKNDGISELLGQQYSLQLNPNIEPTFLEWVCHEVQFEKTPASITATSAQKFAPRAARACLAAGSAWTGVCFSTRDMTDDRNPHTNGLSSAPPKRRRPGGPSSQKKAIKLETSLGSWLEENHFCRLDLPPVTYLLITSVCMHTCANLF